MTLAEAPAAASRSPFAWLREWREWPDDLARLWRRSLRFRIVVITLGLTALAVLVACVWMALQVQNDLFVSRRDQVLVDSRRATAGRAGVARLRRGAGRRRSAAEPHAQRPGDAGGAVLE